MTEAVAFIDPGPRLVQFLSAVGDRFGPNYRPVFYSIHVKSRSLISRLGHEVRPHRRMGTAHELPQGISIDTAALLGRLRRSSDAQWVRSEHARYLWLVGSLNDFLDTVAPAGVFLWNGSGLAATIAEQLARARGIPVIFGENGYLPGTLQIDSQGVNAFSSIGQDLGLDAIRSTQYTHEQREAFDTLLDAYRSGRAPRLTSPPRGRVRPSLIAYAIQALQDLREREPSVKGNRLIPRTIPPLPKRFVFFPLQVKSDSQLTIHSPLYGNRLEEAVADVRAALRSLDHDLGLVVKLHPADLSKTDYDPAVRAHPDVVWVGGGDVRDLLRPAAAVVTVNSTVAIEALVFGKPVVALGRNFFVREGLVYPVRDRVELAAALDRALGEAPDPELAGQFLRYLYFTAFVRAHSRDFSAESTGNVARRIIELIRGAHPG